MDFCNLLLTSWGNNERKQLHSTIGNWNPLQHANVSWNAQLCWIVWPWNLLTGRFRLRYSTTCNSYYRDWFDAIDPSSQGVITGWDKALYTVDSVRRHIDEDIGQVTMVTCWSLKLLETGHTGDHALSLVESVFFFLRKKSLNVGLFQDRYLFVDICPPPLIRDHRP